MSDIAICINNISKCYHIYENPRDRLKQLIASVTQNFGAQKAQYFKEFWALRNVSFDIKRGETVGIIGRNGSGKSTLLQLICGTLTPSAGSIHTYGRIAALLELGSGFNPEFTGRENVYMSGFLMGLTEQEIDAKFDDVASFADIGNFIEQPVKTYSSGMFVRLAFAVNIVSEPDIMIVDEALAVGDGAFQAKCMTALTRTQERGATVLFVSHDVGAMKSLCSRAIYLENGAVIAIGKGPEVAELYVKKVREEMNAEHLKFAQGSSLQSPIPRTPLKEVVTFDISKDKCDEFSQRVATFRYGSGGVKVFYVELLNMDGSPINYAAFNQEVKVRIYIESYRPQTVSINFNILDDKKTNLVGCDFLLVGQGLLNTEAGEQYVAEYQLRLPLLEGNYSLRTQITSPVVSDQTAVFLDVIEDAAVFQVGRWGVARIWSKVHLFPSLQLSQVDTKSKYVA